MHHSLVWIVYEKYNEQLQQDNVQARDRQSEQICN